MNAEELADLLRRTSWVDDPRRDRQAAAILNWYDVARKTSLAEEPAAPPPEEVPVAEVHEEPRPTFGRPGKRK